MKKSIELVGLDKVLQLSRGTALHIEKKLFHLDQLTDGSWRVTFTSSLMPSDEVLQGIRLAVKGKEATATIEYEGHLPLTLAIKKLAPIMVKPNQAKDLSLPMMLHFDQLEDGTWKLLYSKGLVPDIAALSQLKIIRETLV